MLSILFNEQTVMYSFNDILQLMVCLNFERVDKKLLSCNRLVVVGTNTQVFYTDGVFIDIKLITHDECFVNFEGVLELIDQNDIGEKEEFETLLVNCTSRVIKIPNHSWTLKYITRLKDRINGSFDLYFKIVEQYVLANKPHIDKIGATVDRLVSEAEHNKQTNDVNLLRKAYHGFDQATVLMIQCISNP
ncbi:hypothetical protein [Diatraea saccharalis granulovirus]|uniref:Uncharacterized protein n=1 Tax=Diatraea saccharalis granulovirus TaxID=1675862 RepID=A0A0R7EYV9_9BBAC|nr:hypothetical protein [Diatraea saccharalis granulovirus]AKN80768.1 hypothetical protein [Diatraea saccharalis granulovirus]